MRPGDVIEGPALVAEYSSTTYLPPGARGEVHESGSLILEWSEGVE